MVILLLTVDALPRVGGISLMAHHLANAWAATSDVVFVAPEGSYVHGRRRAYRFLEDTDSRVQERSGPAGLAQDDRIRALVGRIIDRYRVTRTVLLHPFYYGIGSLDACKGRVPLSVYVHGTELRSQLAGNYPKNLRGLIRARRVSTLRERLFYTIAQSDEVLVNSAYTRSLVEGFDVRPSVRVTGCGVPRVVVENELRTTRTYDRALRRVDRHTEHEGPHLVFVGRLVRAKHTDRLFRLARLIPDATVTIVGSGPDESRLQTLVDRLGLNDRVRMLGSVLEATKWDVLRTADFSCLLSEPDDRSGNVEGFGIALLEGAAAGGVPVSSGTGGMTDVVRHGVNGLILPDDDVSAATLLRETFADEQRMNDLVRAARRQLVERFNWDAVAATIASRWT